MTLVERRIGLLFAFFLVLLLFALARTVYLGTIKGGTLSHAASTQHVVSVDVPARRGTIVDRKGVELAVSQPASDVSATPYLVKDPVRTTDRLAPILGTKPSKLLAKLVRRTGPGSGFVYLARHLPAAKADAIQKLKIAGITLTPSELRDYPLDWMASQVIGAVGTDGTGLSGLEFTDNRMLRGTDGERRLTRDALGQTLQVDDVKVAKPGARLELTLDSAIQRRTEKVLKDLGKTYSPNGASAIVMDPRTNEILAMANWPRVDANDPGGAPTWAQQNRATGFNYEPGSTFKAFTVAGALQDHLVTPTTQFDLPPSIQVADRSIHDAEDRGPESLSTAGILAQSSNVGAIKIGLRLGASRFDHWVRRFGFGAPTGVDLPGEERGQVLPVSKYSGSSMGNLPIGQGESVTPLQMATAYSAIANGGILRAPRIVRRVDGKLVPRPKGRRVISGSVAAELRDMLEGVLAPGGTASEVSIPGYKLAGKTGTANKVDPVTHLYSKSKYIASFMGFAPAQHPRLLVAVMVDEPHGSIFGGQVAAPAFGKIAEFALPYLRIPPS